MNSKQFGSRSLRRRIEASLAGIVFVVTAVYFVGGAFAMILKGSAFVA